MREPDQLGQRLSEAEALVTEPLEQAWERFLDRQRAQRQRAGLREQRPFALLEHLTHHRALGARVHVARSVSVILDG